MIVQFTFSIFATSAMAKFFTLTNSLVLGFPAFLDVSGPLGRFISNLLFKRAALH
jgi:hypothetical protein